MGVHWTAGVALGFRLPCQLLRRELTHVFAGEGTTGEAPLPRRLQSSSSEWRLNWDSKQIKGRGQGIPFAAQLSVQVKNVTLLDACWRMMEGRRALD